MALSKTNRIKLIIKEYLSANKVSEELTTEFRRWIIGSGHREEKIQALDDLLEDSIHFEPNPHKETLEAYEKIAHKLGFSEMGGNKIAEGVSRKRPFHRTLLRIAAVLCPVILGVGATFYLMTNREHIEEFPTVVAHELLVSTPEGEQKHTTLPDESSVWINSQSEIKYEENFDSERIVELKGEGYFNVKKTDDKPFYVAYNDVKVTVLGTVFSIASPEEGVTEISLYEGLLRVDVPDRFYLLPPKHVLRYNKRDDMVSIMELSRSKPDWMRNIINFRLEPVSEVLRSIGRIYGYDIRMTDLTRLKLETEIVTLKFEEEIGFRDLLSIVSDISGFSYTINNKEVNITMKQQINE